MDEFKHIRSLSICMFLAAFCFGQLGFIASKNFQLTRQARDLNAQLEQKERALEQSEIAYKGLLQIIHDKGLVKEAEFKIEQEGNPTKFNNFEWTSMCTTIDTVYGSYDVTFKKVDKPREQTKQEAVGYSQLHIGGYGDVSFVSATTSTPLATYRAKK